MCWLREAALASRRRCRVGVFNRSDEAIAASGDGGDISTAEPAFAERPSEGRDLDLEIALLDNGVGPDAGCQFVLADQLAWALDQCAQDFQGTTAEPNGRLTLQQQLSCGQKAERTERLIRGHHRLRTCLVPPRTRWTPKLISRLALDEGQQVRIDCVWMGGTHAVR